MCEHYLYCSLSLRATKGRNMTKVVQDFLWAQKVQEPIALFSDWLYVGHVDEFMTFVPAPNRKVNITKNTLTAILKYKIVDGEDRELLGVT